MKICSCAVIGQHPTRFKFKYNEYMTSCKRIKKRMRAVFVSLYQRGVRCFFVGGALGVDMWAGEILLDMQRPGRISGIGCCDGLPLPRP